MQKIPNRCKANPHFLRPLNQELRKEEIDYLGFKWRLITGNGVVLKREGIKRAHFVCSQNKKKGCSSRLYKTKRQDGTIIKKLKEHVPAGGR
jgi:hypothetical protein